ncbi:hypothetical protein D3C85_1408570 [compost metagenome]
MIKGPGGKYEVMHDTQFSSLNNKEIISGTTFAEASSVGQIAISGAKPYSWIEVKAHEKTSPDQSLACFHAVRRHHYIIQPGGALGSGSPSRRQQPAAAD